MAEAVWTNNLGPFLGATERAQKAGLKMAAETYAGRVRERLLKGYTSGAFTQGHAAGSVQVGTPEMTPNGATVAVGSTQLDPPYPLYWELGHHNIFIAQKGQFFGGYVRIPVWEPLMVEMRQELVGIVAEEIKAIDGAL